LKPNIFFVHFGFFWFLYKVSHHLATFAGPNTKKESTGEQCVVAINGTQGYACSCVDGCFFITSNYMTGIAFGSCFSIGLLF
jgi:hypothetical protein